MTVVGITGHRTLPDDSEWSWVRDEIGRTLDRLDAPLEGVSSLAEGADQCFAEVVLTRGGTLHAVVAFDGFRASIDAAVARDAYDTLLARAATVEVMPPADTREAAYLAAGVRVVELSDAMLAVWDGLPARGVGGTAEIVEHARRIGRPVVHIDPRLRTVTRS